MQLCSSFNFLLFDWSRKLQKWYPSYLPMYFHLCKKNRWYWKWLKFLSYFPYEERTKLKNTESLIVNNNYFLIWLKVIFSKTFSWKWKQRKFQNQIQKFLEFFFFRRFVAADVTPCSWNHKLVLPAECRAHPSKRNVKTI